MEVSKRAKVVELGGVAMAVLQGYSRYGVNRLGCIYDFEKLRFVNVYDRNGYKSVPMKSDNLGRKTWWIHRFVCMCFHDNPNSKPWVNHKDGKKDNNAPDNLEWSTIKENTQHAWDTGLQVAKTGTDHWRFGKTLTEEHRKKLSTAKIGERHPKFKGWYHTPMGKFSSFEEGSKVFGISRVALFRKFNKYNGSLGWSFEASV